MNAVVRTYQWLHAIIRHRRSHGSERHDLQSIDRDAEMPVIDNISPTGPSLLRILARSFTNRIGELIALSLAINLLSLAVPVFVLQVYDRVIFHGGLVTLTGLVIGVLLAVGFDFVLRQARSRLVQVIGLRIDATLIKALIGHLVNLPLGALESQGNAKWQTLFHDHELVRDTLSSSFTLLFIDIPFIAIFLIVVWMVAPPIAGILLLIIPIYIAFAAVSSWAVASAARDEQDTAREKDSLTTELITGRLAVKSLGLGGTLADRWGGAHAKLVERSIVRGARSDTFQNLSVVLGMSTTIAITSFGAVAIVEQQMTIGGLIAANMLASRIVQPLMQMIGTWRTVSRLRAAIGRFESLLAQPLDASKSAVSRDKPRGLLMLQDVVFGYDEKLAPTLNGLSIVIGSCGLHGLTGRNGSGKTTLLKVMQGLYAPVKGRVSLDGADIAQFGRDDLSRWIGYVPQEPLLISGSIRDNIAGFATDIDDAAILNAAKKVGASAFIDALPEGYATEVGEGGRRFSSGQRQLIALARAILYNPSVLLLDEPTASLDEEAAQHLIRQLRQSARCCTIIAVTHNPQLLRACDIVFTLETGTIITARQGRISSEAGRASVNRTEAA